jgi:hypothetical protein
LQLKQPTTTGERRAEKDDEDDNSGKMMTMAATMAEKSTVVSAFNCFHPNI